MKRIFFARLKQNFWKKRTFQDFLRENEIRKNAKFSAKRFPLRRMENFRETISRFSWKPGLC